MTTARRLVILSIAVFAAGHVFSAEAGTLVFRSAFTIPPALELHAGDDPPSIQLLARPGETAVAELPLRVGTNDWPVRLHLGLLHKSPGEFVFLYQFAKEDVSPGVWVSLPAFCADNPVDLLPHPAWTDYTLAVRVTPPEGTEPGSYTCTLRLLLRSRSGRVETVDIPVELVVD